MKKPLQTFLPLAFALLVGCSVEIENPANPTPISPNKKTAESDRTSTADNSGGTSASKSFEIPALSCNVVISRGAANSSGKDGAGIVVADSDATRNGDLLIRLSSTGSFQEVKEQTFTSAQSYNFEFRRADGVGCLVQNVFVSPDDVNNKVLLTLQVTFP